MVLTKIFYFPILLPVSSSKFIFIIPSVQSQRDKVFNFGLNFLSYRNNKDESIPTY